MRGAVLAVALCFCGAAAAQVPGVETSPAVPRSPVVVLDSDRLFTASLFGRRVLQDIEAAQTELQAENSRLAEELEAEEQDLAERRAEMEPDAFRELAGEFDSRVTELRRRQDAKALAIQQQSERARALFQERANPILIEIAGEVGAQVILDRRDVIVSAVAIDVTELAIARIDSDLGGGAGLVTETPAPIQRPELLRITPEPADPPEAEAPAD